MSINIVVLAGKLAFEPEVKALESGLMVANLTIDVENKVKDSNGTIRYESCPIRCECFGDLADIARMMYKGQMVIAEGRLKYREYTNKQGKVVSINSVGLTKLSLADGGEVANQGSVVNKGSVVNQGSVSNQGYRKPDSRNLDRMGNPLPF